MRILHLTLHKKWFCAILSGKKKVEYRENTDYWWIRLFKKHTHVKFVNGYGLNRPWMVVEIKRIDLMTNPFEIHLGGIKKTGNLKILKKNENNNR